MSLKRCAIAGKLTYPARGLAKDAMAEFASRRRDGEARERSLYHCVHCNGWHLSSWPQRMVDKRSREDRVIRARLRMNDIARENLRRLGGTP